MKRLIEPVTKTIKDGSDDLTWTMTETSKQNSEALSDLNDKFLEKMKDRSLIAFFCCVSYVKSLILNILVN